MVGEIKKEIEKRDREKKKKKKKKRKGGNYNWILFLYWKIFFINANSSKVLVLFYSLKNKKGQKLRNLSERETI